MIRKQKPGPLSAEQITRLLRKVPTWAVENGELVKTFHFKNYYENIAFVNATAWVSHHEDHHPDLEVGYNRCRVRYSTHDVGGLSAYDFVCAGKVEELAQARPPESTPT